MPERFDLILNLGSLLSLPSWSKGPRGDVDAIAAVLRAEGFVGVEGGGAAAFRAFGLAPYGIVSIKEASSIHDALLRQRDEGFIGTTVHLGTGFEDEMEAYGLFETLLAAASSINHPVRVETHRATLTQDVWRTMQFVQGFPELRLTADLSHWYTGLEMRYGDFSAKLDWMGPIFERVRFIHGRVSSMGCIQVPLQVGRRDEPHRGHFIEMWTRCMAGFLATAEPDERLGFAPEILPHRIDAPDRIRLIEYACVNNQGEETHDRWQQVQLIASLGKDCWRGALRKTGR